MINAGWYYRIHEIVNSAAGRAACIAATESGLPALAGIEPEIVRELGDQYRSTFMATNKAGAIVGRLMQDLNIYERVGQRPMPKGSVASSATVWKKKR
jgi:hypothetical protein